MRRVFWLAMGITAGAVVARKVTRTIDALTPQSVAGSLAESLAILGDGVRDFVEDVREGMDERERVLRGEITHRDAGPRRLVYVPPDDPQEPER